jgi:hypothetical protein
LGHQNRPLLSRRQREGAIGLYGRRDRRKTPESPCSHGKECQELQQRARQVTETQHQGCALQKPSCPRASIIELSERASGGDRQRRSLTSKASKIRPIRRKLNGSLCEQHITSWNGQMQQRVVECNGRIFSPCRMLSGARSVDTRQSNPPRCDLWSIPFGAPVPCDM